MAKIAGGTGQDDPDALWYGYQPRSIIASDFPGPESAFPKKPLTVKTGDDARRAHDSRVLREAAVIWERRSKPRGHIGRVIVKVIANTLRNAAKAIEEGKV